MAFCQLPARSPPASHTTSSCGIRTEKVIYFIKDILVRGMDTSKMALAWIQWNRRLLKVHPTSAQITHRQ